MHGTSRQRTRPTRTLALGAGVALAVAVPAAAMAAAPSAPSTRPDTAATKPGPAPKTLKGKGHNDRGPKPTVYDIHTATTKNPYYRDTLWTGEYLQLTVMSIRRGDDIGLEMHPKLDQFIRIEAGQGVAKMGPSKNKLNYVRTLDGNSVVLIPAGTWHDVINTGKTALKLYSIYAPPNHPRATLHKTKQDATKDPLEKIKYPQDYEAN